MVDVPPACLLPRTALHPARACLSHVYVTASDAQQRRISVKRRRSKDQTGQKLISAAGGGGGPRCFRGCGGEGSDTGELSGWAGASDTEGEAIHTACWRAKGSKQKRGRPSGRSYFCIWKTQARHRGMRCGDCGLRSRRREDAFRQLMFIRHSRQVAK